MSKRIMKSVIALSAWLLAMPALGQQAQDKQQRQQPKKQQQAQQSGKAAPAKTAQRRQGAEGKAQAVTGKVKGMRQTRVGTKNGGAETNRVVLLETQQGQKIAVDLGPEARLKDVAIKQGVPLSVSGTVVSVEGDPVFIAQSFRVGDRQVQVKRKQPDQARRPSIQTVSGQIGQIRDMDIKNTDATHRVAVLETDQKGKMLVDLGPKEQLEQLELDKGDQARITGIAMNISQRKVLVAQRVQAGGKSVTVQREALPSAEKLQKAGRKATR